MPCERQREQLETVPRLSQRTPGTSKAWRAGGPESLTLLICNEARSVFGQRSRNGESSLPEDSENTRRNILKGTLMTFCISPLDRSEFDHLLGASEQELKEAGAKRVEANTHPGFPCRISLEEAAIGETVLLLNYEHLAVATPYRSRHAIFVRESAQTYVPIPNQIPESIRLRLLSVRAFDTEGMMVDADVVHGRELEPVLNSLLENPKVDYLHLHNAKPGCFAARVDRT